MATNLHVPFAGGLKWLRGQKSPYVGHPQNGTPNFSKPNVNTLQRHLKKRMPDIVLSWQLVPYLHKHLGGSPNIKPPKLGVPLMGIIG